MDISEIQRILETDMQLQALIPDTRAIADALFGIETYTVTTEIGAGSVLATLGLESGNALLDVIKTTPEFRHVWPMIEQGRLDLSSPLVEDALSSLVSAEVITAAEKLALMNLCTRPVAVSEDAVKRAVWNDDGSLAIQIGG